MKEQNQNADPLRQEQSRFNEFRKTHHKSSLDYKGQTLEYYSCGDGPCTILIPPHISSLFPTEMGYRHILDFESSFRVIAPSLIAAGDLDEIAESLLLVLEKEKIDDVILFGGSGSGITAQVFFYRYHSYARGMILTNTVAPGKSGIRTPMTILLRLLPAALLKSVLRKRLSKPLDIVNVPQDLIPRLELTRFLLNESFDTRFSKRKLTLELNNTLRFNDEGIIEPEALKDWEGRILIITSEDDAGYNDSQLLSRRLPNSELYVLEKGYGHLAPAVKSQEVREAIDDFISSLDGIRECGTA
jgi:pimeloyl-ACP methyl ester carboxylesterase